ncbi:hypothetical protein ACHAWO_003266 [Cyclotella atomus]|uniref:Uncharacterized protein n=1 Tax=Cyclotella atomus TaxID=382360 RepID=A0ABD3P5S2_9STRA
MAAWISSLMVLPYAVNRCIASDKCSEFSINTRVIEALDSYVVAENGKELTERVEHGDEVFGYTFADMIMMALQLLVLLDALQMFGVSNLNLQDVALMDLSPS